MRHGPIRRGALSINGSMIIVSDRGRRSAGKAAPADASSFATKATPDAADGQDGAEGESIATKAHGMPGGRGLPDPRQRILEAARQVERSPDWDERHPPDKLAGETKGHVHITD